LRTSFAFKGIDFSKFSDFNLGASWGKIVISAEKSLYLGSAGTSLADILQL
jgi:hypothetical protein